MVRRIWQAGPSNSRTHDRPIQARFSVLYKEKNTTRHAGKTSSAAMGRKLRRCRVGARTRHPVEKESLRAHVALVLPLSCGAHDIGTPCDAGAAIRPPPPFRIPTPRHAARGSLTALQNVSRVRERAKIRAFVKKGVKGNFVGTFRLE